MIKKILLLLMVAVFLFSIFSCKKNSTERLKKELLKLGLSDSDEISRAELAKLLFSVCCLDENAFDYHFRDVDADNSKYVNAVVGSGLMTPKNEDFFLPDEKVAESDLVRSILLYCGLKDSQIGEGERNCYNTALNMGLLEGVQYSASSYAKVAFLKKLFDNSTLLYSAMHSEQKSHLIINGAAQPVFDYDRAVRFCVYVETDYDTDIDGKADLIKVLVQLPYEVLEGLKVPCIFEARPYIAGPVDTYAIGQVFDKSIDLAQMYNTPEKRTPSGECSLSDAVQNADESDWHYKEPKDSFYKTKPDNVFEDVYSARADEIENTWYYEDLDWYDYYLVRGFGIIESAGPGTLGSEGICTAGTKAETDVFRSVIEWLSGRKRAYTNLTDNIEIKAVFSNGSVGMTGRSYAGTTQFALATTGVEGLKTIVPVAGLTNWYDYLHSQGIDKHGIHNDAEYIAWYCNSRCLAEDYDSTSRHLNEVYYTSLIHDNSCNYSNKHKERDYLTDAAKIKCSALIVQGANDAIVTPKQADLMFKACKSAGVVTKMIFHQGTHLTPTYPKHRTEMYVNGELYDTILNRWFCRFLLDVDNGIENMPAVTWQNNYDGSWETFSEYVSEKTERKMFSDVSEKKTNQIVFSDNTFYNACSERTNVYEELFATSKSGLCCTYTFDVDNDLTIMGNPIEVHIRACADVDAESDIYLGAMLIDSSDADFYAFYDNVIDSDGYSYINEQTIDEEGGWQGGGLANYKLVEFLATPHRYKEIAEGCMDMANPEAQYIPDTVSDDTSTVKGEYRDYVIYLNPNIYRVFKGHKLILSVFAANPFYPKGDMPSHTITVDNSESFVVIPVSVS